MPKKSKKLSAEQNSYFDAPTVEIFGSALALLIIVFILSNIVITQDIKAMLERSTEGAKFNVSWENGAEGFVVITHTDKLRIIETNQSVATGDICKPDSAFIQYVEKIYNNSNKQQLIFAITKGSVATMAVARECLRVHYPNRTVTIGWIIANQDLLSTVQLKNLPERIKKTIKK